MVEKEFVQRVPAKDCCEYWDYVERLKQGRIRKGITGSDKLTAEHPSVNSSNRKQC